MYIQYVSLQKNKKFRKWKVTSIIYHCYVISTWSFSTVLHVKFMNHITQTLKRIITYKTSSLLKYFEIDDSAYLKKRFYEQMNTVFLYTID